jgi:hypothetical protein
MLNDFLKKWKKWSFPSKVTIIGLPIGLISIILGVIPYLTPGQTPDKLPDNSYNLQKTVSFPGVSASFVLNLKELAVSERKFILDLGQSLDSNRLSLYLDTENNLVYRIIDKEGEIFSIKVLKSFHNFMLNTWHHIYLDYGITEKYSFMRLYINNKLVDENIINHNVSFSYSINTVKSMIILLNDLSKKSPSNALIALFSLSNKTFTEIEIRKVMNVSIDYLENINAFD